MIKPTEKSLTVAMRNWIQIRNELINSELSPFAKDNLHNLVVDRLHDLETKYRKLTGDLHFQWWHLDIKDHSEFLNTVRSILK